mmetsp:Transcript_105978/g.285027  ORF Transcript_105978/g.285027 Transcript_105978/m.285027 type:complete len:228 (-) Transcript_105978:267-950(-)
MPSSRSPWPKSAGLMLFAVPGAAFPSLTIGASADSVFSQSSSSSDSSTGCCTFAGDCALTDGDASSLTDGGANARTEGGAGALTDAGSGISGIFGSGSSGSGSSGSADFSSCGSAAGTSVSAAALGGDGTAIGSYNVGSTRAPSSSEKSAVSSFLTADGSPTISFLTTGSIFTTGFGSSSSDSSSTLTSGSSSFLTFLSFLNFFSFSLSFLSILAFFFEGSPFSLSS